MHHYILRPDRRVSCPVLCVIGRIDLIRINNIKIVPSEKFCFKEVKDNGLPDEIKSEIKRLILKKLKVPEDRIIKFEIYKQSIDARKKEEVKVVFSIDVSLKDENAFIRKNRDKDIVLVDSHISNIREKSCNTEEKKTKEDSLETSNNSKIIIVGAGPAGLMCALRLAAAGLKPLLLERGEDVDSRMKTVGEFWQGKTLNPSSNVQFGEGGAGTFSDGKLNTMVKDKEGYMKEVYRIFVENGADESIMYVNKPHIGTDKLTEIVKSIRKKIIELGGEVRFSSQVIDIKLSKLCEDNLLNKVGNAEGKSEEITAENIEGNTVGKSIENTEHRSHKFKVMSVVLSDGSKIECDNLVLALGHSARDTFEMLAEKGVYMEQKPFAMGVRVQHPRDFIDKQQYGNFAKYLPAADYKLTFTREGKRSVYSFCMCPGGSVVNASSEEGRLAVNGMSYSDRNSRSSNSAIVVQVSPEDYPGEDALAGMRLQRKLEEDAYKTADGKIPVQNLEDFSKEAYKRNYCKENAEKSNVLENKDVIDPADNHELPEVEEILGSNGTGTKNPDMESFVDGICSGNVYFEENEPECRGLWQKGNLTEFLPKYITESLLDAFPEFGKSIKGYNSKNTLLLGLESRTSSPVRILRGQDLQSVNVSGLYPCGEGAGYAGGITSAAMDGLKIADKIINECHSERSEESFIN